MNLGYYSPLRSGLTSVSGFLNKSQRNLVDVDAVNDRSSGCGDFWNRIIKQ